MKRMLIVDDEPDLCDCLAQFFQTRGFVITVAFSGEEALEQLRAGGVDVALLDIKLPGIHGLEVLKQIKAQYPDSKVVMVTGLLQPELRMTANRYGACDYITKPFDFSDETWASVLATEG